MKKILCLVDSLGYGGAQRQLSGLAVLLKDKGYTVKILSYYNIHFYLQFLLDNNVDYECINEKRPLHRIFKIRKCIKDYSPDYVISYLDTPSVIACMLKATGFKYKLIVSERNITTKLNFRAKIKFFLYRYSDYIVSNSHTQNLFIHNNYPKLSSKSIAITNFTDLSLFKPISGKVRNKIPRLLVLASLIPSKNTLRFIDAIKILKDRNYDFTVDWFGETVGDYADQCLRKVKELSIDNIFHIHHKTDSPNTEYQHSDFFCLPSIYEGTPNALCEAIACGLPVVCSDASDNSLYVKSGCNGYLMDPLSEVSIAEAIEKLFALTDIQYFEFSKTSREIAESKLSKERFVNEYIGLIEE